MEIPFKTSDNQTVTLNNALLIIFEKKMSFPATSESCFFLFVNYKEQDDFVKNEIDVLIKQILDLNLESDLNQSVKGLFSEIFRLRMKALELIRAGTIDLDDIFEEAYPYFESMANNPRLSLLGENILFALRSNERVVNSLFPGVDLAQSLDTNSDLAEGINYLSSFNYEQYLNFINQNVPPALSVPTTEWLDSSLKIELSLLVSALINDGKLSVSDQAIDNLAAMVADATQTYNAIAIEIGILKLDKDYQPNFKSKLAEVDPEFISEQKKIAEAGLDHFSKNWD